MPVKRNRRVLSTMLMALLISGSECAGSTGPEATLQTARAKWARHGFDDYSITISRSCECLVEMSEPAVVVVRDGVVESRTYVRTGLPVRPEFAGGFPSVEGLFEDIEEGLAGEGNGNLSVDYHPVFGYPVRYVFGDPAVDAPGTFAKDLRPV